MRRLKLSDSSSVAEIGYDPIDRDLEVRFVGTPDKIYRYKNVPSRTYLEILASKSFGSYLAKNVKGAFQFDVSDAPVEAIGLSVNETFLLAADLRLALEAAETALELARQSGAPGKYVTKIAGVLARLRAPKEEG